MPCIPGKRTALALLGPRVPGAPGTGRGAGRGSGEARLPLAAGTAPHHRLLRLGGARELHSVPATASASSCSCDRPPARQPAMASIKDLEGKWRLTESQGFEEYMKELGVGLALRKMGAMAKPDCIITCDGNNITVKTESTLKTTQFCCTLGEKFDETTADGRKTQTVCTFTDGALVQHQQWDGKESTITRKLKDGKLVVDCVMNDVTCTRVYEKVE